MKSPELSLVIARPVYTAPELDLSTAIRAWVKSTPGAQPLIVPSSVAKRNIPTPDVTPFETEKDSVGFPRVMLKTVPVGAPEAALPGAGGMITVSGTFWPAPL